MPKALSHTVVLTDDIDEAVRLCTEVAGLGPVGPYDVAPEIAERLLGWTGLDGPVRACFVGESPGALDLLAHDRQQRALLPRQRHRVVDRVLEEVPQRTRRRRAPHRAAAHLPGQFRRRVLREPRVRVVRPHRAAKTRAAHNR